MPKNKKGELSFVALLSLLFGSVLIVSAAVLNATDNSSVNISLNDTLLNISLSNESITNQSIIGDVTLINETTQNQSIISNETVNLTFPIENISINQSINLTINETISITLPKKLKNLSEIVEKHKNKLNDETEKYLKNIKDKKEGRKYIIKFKNSIDESKFANVTLDKKIEKFKVTKISGEVEDIEDLIEDTEIEFLELEQEVEVLGENIPFNIKKIKADSAWNLSKGSNVKVAVLDTGIGAHNDLAVAGGVSFVDNTYYDSNGHGTSVAGVIAALLNDEGLAGTAPEVSLYSVKIMQGSTGDLSNAIAGIEWAIDNNISIVSMSFGLGSYSQIFKEALQEAYNHNIVLVAASGNEATDNILYPAKYDTVIAVGAVDSDDNLASFSSYGFEQELVAPGVDINSTYLGNVYSILSGTSLAAPHVAGVAALIKAFNNSLTNEQIRAKLRNDALDLGTAGKDDLYGYGLVQVRLNTTNYTFTNTSYFYEVFNISNYGLPNITYNFWLNGTGTIDDVDFLPGYYLVNITFNNSSKRTDIYQVIENGTILVLIQNINLSDQYTLACPSGVDCKHDNIVFKTHVMNARMTDDSHTVLAECFDWTNDGFWDDCYGTQTNINNCKNGNPTFDTRCQEADGSSCTTNGGLGTGQVPTSTSKIDDIDGFFCYFTTIYELGNEPPEDYYICNQRQYVCTSSTQYADRCFYTGGNKDIGTGTCAADTPCDSSADEENADFGTNGTSTPTSPCRGNQTTQPCNGTISVIVTDSKSNPINGTKVYNNGNFTGTTDTDGFKEITYTNAVCGNSQSIDIYCSDNATFCGTKSSTIDNNNDYDSLSFSCNVCVNKTDLSIKTSDVTIKKQGNKKNITALITVEKVTASNIVIISVSQYQNQNVSVLWDTNSTDFVSITVDFTNVVAETDDKNNYARKSTNDPINAYIEVTTDYPVLENAIKNFLGQYVNSVSQGSQEVNIYVGRKNSNIPKVLQETNEKPKQRWGLINNIVNFNSKSEGLPYNGIVVRSGTNIYVFGNEIDGDLAALRKLVDNQEFYFSKSGNDRVDYVSEENLGGLFVFDYLHTDENQAKYRKNNANFAKVVENVLNSDVSTLAIKRVLTTNDNTSLRIKHINAELGPKFREFINPQPVVLARGLWSNLFTWEKLAKEIAQGVGTGKPRDTWLIEITGGPNTECVNCPNYNFSELTDYYWPALISGVQTYSNKTNVTYIGFSNGCRVALRSLEKYQNTGKQNAGYYHNGSDWRLINLTANPRVIDTFVAVGCPGTFHGDSPFAMVARDYGNNILQELASNSHLPATDVGIAARNQCYRYFFNTSKTICYAAASSLVGNDSVSYNLLRNYIDWVRNGNGSQPGTGLTVNNFLMIYGRIPQNQGFFGWVPPGVSDGVVPYEDSLEIDNSITVLNRHDDRVRIDSVYHTSSREQESLPDRSDTKQIIKNFINGG
ncbi:S8 family serine peptidase [Candidatus Woesearchaeota archaeon]|nr:S8 family serine peptidase [Candidatus Woesearchaeota archaeon]